MAYKRVILEDVGVEVHFNTTSEEKGDHLLPTFPKEHDITKVLYFGIDIKRFLDDSQLDELTCLID